MFYTYPYKYSQLRTFPQLNRAGLPAAVGPADFASTAALKEPLLAVAARALVRGEGRAAELQGAFHAFCAAEADWLEDAALFSALSRARYAGRIYGCTRTPCGGRPRECGARHEVE